MKDSRTGMNSRLVNVANVQGEVHPRTDHEDLVGEYRYSSTLSLTLAPDRGGESNATPRPLYLQAWHGTHCTGSSVGPRAGLNACGKSRPHRSSISEPFGPYWVPIHTTLYAGLRKSGLSPMSWIKPQPPSPQATLFNTMTQSELRPETQATVITCRTLRTVIRCNC